MKRTPGKIQREGGATDLLLPLDGAGPAYEQIYRALAVSIKTGVLRQGSRLPSTRELARQLNVGRNTVLAAYERLQSENLVATRRAGGTVVSLPADAIRATRPSSDSILPIASQFAGRLRQSRCDAFPQRSSNARYDLAYGEPLVNPALFNNLAKSLSFAALNAEGRYGEPQGVLELRQQVAAYLGRRRGFRCDADDIVIVGGTQQAVSLIARLLIDEGDTAVFEEPRYERAAQCLALYGAKVTCLPVDESGLMLGGIEPLHPRLVFVTPSHQFPLGARMSQLRREQLLRLAVKKQFWVVEDDYDGEYALDRDASPALKSLDAKGVVIYIGTFSKTIFPALRIGYIVAPPGLRQLLVKAKSLDDIESSGIDQLALAHFMRTGAFERHLRKVTAELRKRRRTLETGLAEHCGDAVKLAGTASGMHCVAWLPQLREPELDRLILRAGERGVGLRSIAPHYQGHPPVPGLLLGFARLSSTQLKVATRIIGECLREIRLAP